MIKEARNFSYTRDGIACEVLTDEYGWIPFHATPYDIEEHGRDLFQTLRGLWESGQIHIEPYEEDEELYLKELTDDIREERNYLLKSSDWTQLDDVPEKIKSEWGKYRQKLRDITSQTGFPENVLWPEEPDL